MSKKHMGSSIDDFLKEEGIFEEAQAQAIKEVVAWQLAEAMKQQKISKSKMAVLLKTSRTQVNRLLDPKNDITLLSLQRAAAMVGRRVIYPARSSASLQLHLKAQGQQLAEGHSAHSVRNRKYYGRIGQNEFGEYLPAGAAGRAGQSVQVRNGNGRDPNFRPELGNRPHQRCPLRANRQPETHIFDIRPRHDFAVGELKRGSHAKF